MLIPPKIMFTLIKSFYLSSFFLIVESQNSALAGLRWPIFWGIESTILQEAVGELLSLLGVLVVAFLGQALIDTAAHRPDNVIII